MLNWVGWVGCSPFTFTSEVLSAAGRCWLPAPVWMKYELQCQLNLSQTSWDELMIREQRCVLMCCLCDGGGGGWVSKRAHYHTLYSCRNTEQTQRRITDEGIHSHRWFCSSNVPLFLPRKILQLNADRLYFPSVNFKRPLPLPLKASCSLRLHLMLFIQMKKTHFSFKRPSFSDILKKGLVCLWKNDGMSVAFHHSSTSRATEGDLH